MHLIKKSKKKLETRANDLKKSQVKLNELYINFYFNFLQLQAEAAAAVAFIQSYLHFVFDFGFVHEQNALSCYV